MVFEGTYNKGHRLPEVEPDHSLLEKGRAIHWLHPSCHYHIAGTRMKASGVDGLSRGDMLERMLKVGADPMQ